jgi:hypothetical protein
MKGVLFNNQAATNMHQLTETLIVNYFLYIAWAHSY